MDTFDGADGLFKKFDAYAGENLFPFSTLVFLVGVVFVFLLLSANDFGTKIAIALALLALVVGFFTLFAQFEEKNIVKVNFDRMWAFPEESEKPLFKALIKIKIKNKEFTLKEIYNLYPQMFTKERLLEKLYE